MAGSLLALRSPDQRPKCQKYLQNFFFRVFQLCFIFLLPCQVVDGEVWLQNSLDNHGAGSKALAFALDPLNTSEGAEKGLCAVCEVKNAMEDSSPINSCS